MSGGPDAAYSSMLGAIRSDRAPNLLVLQYSDEWTVQNLILVPSFFFSEAAVEKRPPLAVTARRAGWVGCNILLSNIAPEGKLRIVRDGIISNPNAVREQYNHIRPLAQVPTAIRGWLLDVLSVIHRIGRDRFSLSEVYGFDSELAAQHPDNQNIRPKIRQKLQVLRDIGLIDFLGAGEYQLRR
jgi:Dam-replacing family.